ncbi:hypothetical protein MKW98_021484 [Papaver atlanticum]|uniref:Uncharacterized protein n=1 Tax=Papaver atlanticum TaxID=357466 RepID=A0AAD4XJI9_9MAGN|nr:hypothetical protein MKW98_021484 [Papaver atlanticum]
MLGGNKRMILSIITRPKHQQIVKRFFTGLSGYAYDNGYERRDGDLQTERIQFVPHVNVMELNYELKKLIETGHINDARRLFDKLPQRDEISWTTMISGYVRASNVSEALMLFSRMWVDSNVQIDSFVLAIVLKACGCNSELNYGRLVHGYSVKTGFVNCVFVGSALLDMYAKCGCIASGCRVFEEMPERNVVSWTAIISALGRAGYNKESLRYFVEMWKCDVECDSHTFASAAKACADSNALNYGREIHTQAIKVGVDSTSFVANTLAAMYNKCGKLEYGLCLFARMRTRDVVSWTTTIATYLQLGREEKAIQTFLQMRESDISPNEFTFAAIISCCAGLAKIKWGEQLHAHSLSMGFMDSLSVANATIKMYSECGSLDSSLVVFHEMSRKDVVTWSTIISGYSQGVQCEEAFQLLSWMRKEGTKPNEFTLASLLSVCGSMAIVELGRQVHAHILSIGIERDVMINSALVNMYSKCGSISEASQIFNATENQDVVSWTAMISGYAEHGYSKQAIDLFEEKSKTGLKPDDVTFIGILSACSHAGLVDLGFHYFRSMSKVYKISPGKEHYGCMIDLLCRVGRLSEAEEMILSMPFKQDDVVWSTLLRACMVHRDAERAKRIVRFSFEIDPNCAGTHITFCNILAADGQQKEAASVRKNMKSKGVVKEPAWSMVRVNKDQFSTFVAGDRSHSQGAEIYSMLDFLQVVSRLEEMTDNSTTFEEMAF